MPRTAKTTARYREIVAPALNGICSSGSTGLPKIILNTAPAMWTPALSTPFMAQWAPVSQPQTILVPAPMYHTNGFNTLNYLLGGDQLVVLEKFDAALVLDVIERHRITTFTATPTMLARIADIPGVEDRDLSSIEWILQGAAVMPQNLLRRWFELLSPERVVMAYGMTENLGLTALRGDEWLDHPGSVGRGFRDTDIRVVDDRRRRRSARATLGEIYLRAPMNDQYRYIGGAPPLPTTPDGFTSAGDIGHLDADGYLYIADRRTDMIVTGGANVFPAEVESALIDHPEHRRRRGDRDRGSAVGPPRARRGSAARPDAPADRAGGDPLRQGPARGVQGAQDRGVRRRDPPHRGDQGQPLGDGRRRAVGEPFTVRRRVSLHHRELARRQQLDHHPVGVGDGGGQTATRRGHHAWGAAEAHLREPRQHRLAHRPEATAGSTPRAGRPVWGVLVGDTRHTEVEQLDDPGIRVFGVAEEHRPDGFGVNAEQGVQVGVEHLVRQHGQLQAVPVEPQGCLDVADAHAGVMHGGHRNEFSAVKPSSGISPSANVSALPRPTPPPTGSSTRTSRSRS